MNIAPVNESNSAEAEDDEILISEARTLIDGSHAGVLCSVDDLGKPHVRWMATFSFDEFPRFYALAGSESRKRDQITHHPDVNWMFSNHDLSLVLNLTGTARVLTDTPTLKRVWKQVEDKSQAYFLNQYFKGAGFVVIETTVQTIECTSPKNVRRLVIDPSQWARS